jgi:hypothetical protein
MAMPNDWLMKIHPEVPKTESGIWQVVAGHA